MQPKSIDTNQHSYDVIIIGSGMGGLTTGSLLAQFGDKRVLVVERHFKLGGFTHSFRRDKYEWDAGVHYVGDMASGSQMRGIMDLVTEGGVEWHKMNSPYERFMFPGESFDVPDGAAAFRAKLIERFPAEGKAITRYFRDVRRAQNWMARWFVSKQYGPFITKLLTLIGKPLATMTTSDYLRDLKDPLLKGILTAQWPDFGSPPDESAFGFHATVTADFMKGGFFPVGGAKEIANHAAAAIEQRGGKCVVSQEVTQIIVRNGKACGIMVRHKGKDIEFNAPVIISNAGAYTTFDRLLPTEYGRAEREQLKRCKPGTSANILFLGLNDDPRNHGFDDCNYWMYSRLDHDIMARHLEGEPDRVDGGFISFSSLRNPGQQPHTAQIISFCYEQDWSEYDEAKWKRRGDEYEQRKVEIAEKMLDYVEARLPGLRKLVSFQELSTPFTVKSFTGHRQGMIYGQACDANRLFRDSWKINTSVPNLYLTGSDVGTPGVNGAMMAGVMTAAKLLGPLGLPQIMGRAMRPKKPLTQKQPQAGPLPS